MSFEMLKMKVIDTGKCIGCGMCARGCKHITMQEPEEGKKFGIPKLTGKCILTRNGLDCGNCYDNCPIVRKAKKKGDSQFLNPREHILNAVKSINDGITIPEISKITGFSTIKSRNEVLRLVELKKVRIEIPLNQQDPIFFEAQ
ncbi:MAG: 4Fe-4S binding protein [Promethearchaeota archaeon]